MRLHLATLLALGLSSAGAVEPGAGPGPIPGEVVTRIGQVAAIPADERLVPGYAGAWRMAAAQRQVSEAITAHEARAAKPCQDVRVTATAQAAPDLLETRPRNVHHALEQWTVQACGAERDAIALLWSHVEHRVAAGDATDDSVAHRLLSALLAVMGQATGASAGSDLLRRVRACVKNGAHGPLQVGELALMVGVTREHLTRVFRHQLGLPPAQYLARQRMLVACDWLRDTPLTVKEVAFRLGFSAPHHFVRMFRRVLGTTPRQFRETGSATPVL